MSKQEEPVLTITMPYIPRLSMDGGHLTEYPTNFKFKIKRFNCSYELHEIVGSRLVYLDGQWHQLGFNAIYNRVD